MDLRRKLVLDVQGGMSMSAACALAGVTRKTGYKWLRRAEEDGLENLSERSRAPKTVCETPAWKVEALLAKKREYPDWGAKKLVALLRAEGISIPLRTADRILARHGLVTPRETEPELTRFERDRCGALLQMDFKGLPVSAPYALLTVLDDMSRFCYHFAPIADRTGGSVKAALWELFGVHGLPDEMLMDNGDCWGSRSSSGPTRFEAWLMRLGIKALHGRPYHPQTQGKVERFHGTAKKELGDLLVQPDSQKVKLACREFVDRYNWIRPHEGIDMAVPGSRYAPWPRTRPAKEPRYEPDRANSRKVCEAGRFTFKGTDYLIGKGLSGERILLQEAEFGIQVAYAGFPLAYLQELRNSNASQLPTL